MTNMFGTESRLYDNANRDLLKTSRIHFLQAESSMYRDRVYYIAAAE